MKIKTVTSAEYAELQSKHQIQDDVMYRIVEKKGLTMKQILKLQKIPDTMILPGSNIPKPAFNKINELVDAVNSLRDDCNLLMGYIAPENKCEPNNLEYDPNTTKGLSSLVENSKTPAENVQDPYAEQRKWVGKLCRFWDDGCVSNYISILKQIDDDETSFADDKGVYWQHCEPVKPDDDIIFKGE